MVSKKGDIQPQEFLGSMQENRGFTVEKIRDHVQEHFKSKQFSPYKFHIYQRSTKCYTPWKKHSDITIERRF